MALSAAGDDGLNSILGGILGAGVGGGHAYDEVLGSFGLDTGGMIGGIVTGLDEFLIRGGDGKDTISGDALASGKTGIAAEIGRASWRGRVCEYVERQGVAGDLQKNTKIQHNNTRKERR